MSFESSAVAVFTYVTERNARDGDQSESDQYLSDNKREGARKRVRLSNESIRIAENIFILPVFDEYCMSNGLMCVLNV